MSDSVMLPAHGEGRTAGAIAAVAGIVWVATLVVVSNNWLSSASSSWSWACWLLLLASLVLLIWSVNYWWGGKRLAAKGILVDGTNRVSLARFQTLLWTLLLFSAIPAAVALNQGRGVADPWAIGLPGDLLVLAGISLLTLATAGIVKNDSRGATPDGARLVQAGWHRRAGEDQLRGIVGDPSSAAGQNLEVFTASAPAKASTSGPAPPSGPTPNVPASTIPSDSPGEDRNFGTSAGHIRPEDASWWDLFVSDAAANLDRLDVARFQQVVLTAALVLVYGVQFAHKLQAGGGVEFPPFDRSLVYLTAISNAAYVGVKTANLRAGEQQPT